VGVTRHITSEIVPQSTANHVAVVVHTATFSCACSKEESKYHCDADWLGTTEQASKHQ